MDAELPGAQKAAEFVEPRFEADAAASHSEAVPPPPAPRSGEQREDVGIGDGNNPSPDGVNYLAGTTPDWREAV